MVPVIRTGDDEITPDFGRVKVMEGLLNGEPATTASHGQPGESVRLNDNMPPRPGKL